MRTVKYLVIVVLTLLMASFSGLYTSLADAADGAIVLDFADYAETTVNGHKSCTIEKTQFDGRSVLSIVPNPEYTAVSSLTIDAYTFASAGIDLEQYRYVAYEYYYKSEKPGVYYMSASILKSGNILTKERHSVNSAVPITANKWSVELFDFSAISEYLNPEAELYNLRQMHFRPFGLNNLSKLSENDTMYISKIMFFKEKPNLTYKTGFIEGNGNGYFNPNDALTRAQACAMVARSIEPEENIVGTSTFKDVAENAWYAKYAGFLQEKGLLGQFGEYLQPDKTITKNELARLVISSGMAQELGEVRLDNMLGSFSSFPTISNGGVSRADAAMIINQLRGGSFSVDEIPERILVVYLDVYREHPYFADILAASVDHICVDGKWVVTSQDPLTLLVDKVGGAAIYDFSAGNSMVSYYDQMEANRINEIRNTKSMEITASNIVYVSSSDGLDTNNGLSESTPVKTLKRANQLAKGSGWAVLLKRGDLWRERMTSIPGVTYSAYGYGEKPKLYGSPENGADPEKWELVYENVETGALIWKYYRNDYLDVGTMVFDDGEGYAMKEIPSCVGNKYYVRGQEDLLETERTPFDYRVELDKNLEFFHSANSTTTSNATVGEYIDVKKATGPLYLRCDNGNPGKVFESIEFNTLGSVIMARDNVTVDNLCIMYTGVHGISAGSIENLTVTNCEFGWIGGSIQSYIANGGTKRTATRLGNGVEVYGSCDGYVIDNCYVYQCYDAGVTHQFSSSTKGDCVMNNVTYSNNLITDCVYSIEYFHGTLDGYVRTGDNILFDSNLLRRAGYGFGSFRPDGNNQRHIRSSDRNNPFTNFVIRNNVFDRSVHQLINAITDREEWVPKMEGNTYIQGVENGFYSFAYFGKEKMDLYASKLMENVLKDKTGKVYFVEYIPYYEYTYEPSKTVSVTDDDRPEITDGEEA